MEYRFNDEGNKRILILLIVLIFVLALAGTFVYLLTNEKIAVMRRIDKVLYYGVNEAFDVFPANDKKVSDGNFKVTFEQNTENGTIKNEIAEGNLHINLNEENEYKIIDLIVNAQGNEIKNSIYQKDDIIYLKFNEVVYQLNEKNENFKYDIEKVKELYNITYKEVKKQLNTFDFYKLKLKEEKQTKMGISITDRRVKEIIIDTCSSLKESEEFINAYASLCNKSNEDVIKDLDIIIENLDNIETDENNVTKIEFYVSGILNEKTEKVIITRIEKSIVKFLVTADIKENNVDIVFEKNSSKLNCNIIKTNNDYSIKINNDAFSLDLAIREKQFTINLLAGIYNFYLNYTTDENDKGELLENLIVVVGYNSSMNIVMNYEGKNSNETLKEEISLGEVKSINELMSSIMSSIKLPSKPGDIPMLPEEETEKPEEEQEISQSTPITPEEIQGFPVITPTVPEENLQ